MTDGTLTGSERYRVELSAPGEVTYTIRFGKLLRPGVVRETQPPGLADTDRGGTATLDNETHVWIAEGPIRLTHDAGDATLSVETTTRGSATLAPGSILRTSCPCYRRRATAAGVVAGGLVGVGAGALGLYDR